MFLFPADYQYCWTWLTETVVVVQIEDIVYLTYLLLIRQYLNLITIILYNNKSYGDAITKLHLQREWKLKGKKIALISN